MGDFALSTMSLLIVIVFWGTEGNMKIQQSHRYPKHASNSFSCHALCFGSSSEDFMALAWTWNLPMQASPLLVAFVGVEDRSARWPLALCVFWAQKTGWRSNKILWSRILVFEKSEIFVLGQVLSWKSICSFLLRTCGLGNTHECLILKWWNHEFGTQASTDNDKLNSCHFSFCLF